MYLGNIKQCLQHPGKLQVCNGLTSASSRENYTTKMYTGELEPLALVEDPFWKGVEDGPVKTDLLAEATRRHPGNPKVNLHRLSKQFKHPTS